MKNNTELQIIAYKIRRHAIVGVYNASSGHPGGSLSIADILSVLYFDEMNVDPSNPQNPDRDRFVLSKGHCAPALYGALAERGIPRDRTDNQQARADRSVFLIGG